jgi:GntR family transcriptional regulator, N-acetylglucosamine utilization regulator
MRIVDRKSQRKLYLQLVDILKDAIDKGELVTGNQLPTEDNLCIQQGVSKAVVRAALQELAQAGYVRRVPGKGTFVETPVDIHGVWLSSQLTENLLDFGVPWKTKVIQKMLSVAPSDLIELFRMESGHQVFKVSRLRFIKDVPTVLETAYVSHDLCPGLALEDFRERSLIELINTNYGIPITRCADSIEVTSLEDREAELLNQKKGETALLNDRILYTSNNRVTAFIRFISISKDHRITFESVRTPGE